MGPLQQATVLQRIEGPPNEFAGPLQAQSIGQPEERRDVCEQVGTCQWIFAVVTRGVRA